jgi:hypothetical protein
MTPGLVALLVLSTPGPAGLSAPTPLSLASREVLAFDPSPKIDPEWGTDDWDWVDRSAKAGTDGKKSVAWAMTASAILPGLGEQYIGRSDRAKLFFVTEGLIWTAFAFYRIEGSQRRDRAVEFAEIYGSASTQGDSDYYEHIGLWLSLEEWHDIVRQDARYQYPDDPDAQRRYFEENKRYDESRSWNWPDDETRTDYRVLRSRFEKSYRNSRLILGAALANRILSMVDVMTLARRHNRALDERKAGLDFRVAPRETVDGLVIGPVLTKRY